MNSIAYTTAAFLKSIYCAWPANLLVAAFLLSKGGWVAVISLLLLFWVSFLQVRIAFDRHVIHGWARAENTPEDFDRAMQVLGFSLPIGRSLEARCRGAVALCKQWFWVSLVQVFLAIFFYLPL